jgi:hypothetical protein
MSGVAGGTAVGVGVAAGPHATFNKRTSAIEKVRKNFMLLLKTMPSKMSGDYST